MKLTKLEKSWILYDVGNSAFTLLVSTIMPIYFNYLASSAGISDENYLAYWGYAASIATLIVALSGPVQALAPKLRSWLRGRAAPGAAGAAVLLLLLLAGIMRSTAGNYTAFIYFQF